jgi:iron complex transport system substrate-binding protein
MSRSVLAAVGAAVLLCAAPAPAAPQRIISLAPSVTETLFVLGVGDRVVGVSSYCDYPPAAQRIERVGTFLQPNVERIIARRPDLVIAVPSPGNRAPVERLERLGVRVLVVNPERIADVLSSIRTIADAVGVAAAGERLVERITGELAAVEAQLGAAPRLRVLMTVGRSPLVAAGRGTYQDELITRARGDNIAATSGRAWPNLTLEFVVAQAPEVIIDASMGSEEAANPGDSARFWARYPTLPAVRTGHLCGTRAYELLRPGPRVAETLELVARCIHPERFGLGSGGQ